MDDEPTTSTAVSSRAVVRAGWLACGLMCVALGAIGVVVPGLPTTVFFIAAAASFTRSSPRLEAWVLGLPTIGPAVRDYRAGRGMPKRAKTVAIAMIVVSVSVSVYLVDNVAIGAVIAAIGVVGVVFVARVPTRVD